MSFAHSACLAGKGFKDIANATATMQIVPFLACDIQSSAPFAIGMVDICPVLCTVSHCVDIPSTSSAVQWCAPLKVCLSYALAMFCQNLDDVDLHTMLVRMSRSR